MLCHHQIILQKPTQLFQLGSKPPAFKGVLLFFCFVLFFYRYDYISIQINKHLVTLSFDFMQLNSYIFTFAFVYTDMRISPVGHCSTFCWHEFLEHSLCHEFLCELSSFAGRHQTFPALLCVKLIRYMLNKTGSGLWEEGMSPIDACDTWKQQGWI